MSVRAGTVGAVIEGCAGPGGSWFCGGGRMGARDDEYGAATNEVLAEK
jgi:hypothetical protein